MKINKIKYLVLIFILLISLNEIKAQLVFHSYFDAGTNNVSGVGFFKNVYRGIYQYKRLNVIAGLQYDMVNNNTNTFTGVDIETSWRFNIKKFHFDLKGYYLLNKFSDISYETNWGIRMETKKFKHFLFALGLNNKTYAINSIARERYNIDKGHSKIHEYLNLTYLITVYIKPQSSKWNIGLSCTNIDYFVIDQPTNPVFNLQSKYKYNSNLEFFLDLWYKHAGMLNINANYFGYFFRGGIKWEISNLK